MMQSNKLFSIAILILMACLIISCDSSSSSNNNDFYYSEITMTDLGAVVPNPVETKITVRSDLRIIYEQGETFWANDISRIDFLNIETICDDLNILSQEDVNLPQGEELCSGSRGIEFSVTSSSGEENSFVISGDVVCKDEHIPEKLIELMDEIDLLVEKYTP